MSKPDAIEDRIPDVESAVALLETRKRAFIQQTEALTRLWCERYPDDEGTLQCTLRALWLGYARMALRHGTWGEDFHAYHNESHTRDILVSRITQVQQAAQAGELSGRSVALLALFAVTHDLRQRESGQAAKWVGPNERASVYEAHRIMQRAGFNFDEDPTLFTTLKLMIEGSTFVSDSQTEAGGATAASIVRLTSQADLEPDWEQLVLLAADLDTANVAEPFFTFAQGSAHLFEELEMRKGRASLGEHSAEPALAFLTVQQRRYFFEFQQFSSTLGRRVYADAKVANAPLLTEAINRLKDQFAKTSMSQVTGRQVLDRFLVVAAELAGAVDTRP